MTNSYAFFVAIVKKRGKCLDSEKNVVIFAVRKTFLLMTVICSHITFMGAGCMSMHRSMTGMTLRG